MSTTVDLSQFICANYSPSYATTSPPLVDHYSIPICVVIAVCDAHCAAESYISSVELFTTLHRGLCSLCHRTLTLYARFPYLSVHFRSSHGNKGRSIKVYLLFGRVQYVIGMVWGIRQGSRWSLGPQPRGRVEGRGRPSDPPYHLTFQVLMAYNSMADSSNLYSTVLPSYSTPASAASNHNIGLTRGAVLNAYVFPFCLMPWSSSVWQKVQLYSFIW